MCQNNVAQLRVPGHGARDYARAHTVKYFPNNKDGRYNQGRSLTDLKKLRNAAGRISVDNQGEMVRMRSREERQGEIGRMDSLGESREDNGKD